MPTAEGYNKIVEALHETYLIIDEGIIKLLLGTVVGNRLNRDPLWVMVVGGSSSGKTELITALTRVKGYTEISEMTPNTFISGMKKADKETSLLLRMKEKDFFVFKDFTTMLNLPKETRNTIMAQLREIYDRNYVKRFGNGVEIKFDKKLGLIAGVTTAIYTSKQAYAQMGERFVMYKPKLPDPIKFTERAMDNAEKDMDKKRVFIRELIHQYLDNELEMPPDPPKVGKLLRDELVQLANLSTLAASPIQRNVFSPKKEIEFAHDRTMPARFATQLSILASGMMIINGGDLEEVDKHILYKISLDSIDQDRRQVLMALTEFDNTVTKNLATKLRYPTELAHRVLEDLNMLGMVDRFKDHGTADRWKLKGQYREIMAKFTGIKMLEAEMPEIEDEQFKHKERELTPEELEILNNTIGIDNGEIPVEEQLGF